MRKTLPQERSRDVKVRDQVETEMFKKRLETVSRPRLHSYSRPILNIDVLMKFTLLPKINKATSHYCLLRSLLSADDFQKWMY